MLPYIAAFQIVSFLLPEIKKAASSKNAAFLLSQVNNQLT